MGDRFTPENNGYLLIDASLRMRERETEGYVLLRNITEMFGPVHKAIDHSMYVSDFSYTPVVSFPVISVVLSGYSCIPPILHIIVNHSFKGRHTITYILASDSTNAEYRFGAWSLSLSGFIYLMYLVSYLISNHTSAVNKHQTLTQCWLNA